MGAGSDTDMIMDLYGWLSLFVLFLIVFFGGIWMIISAIESWFSKRALKRAQLAYDQAKADFHRTHGY